MEGNSEQNMGPSPKSILKNPKQTKKQKSFQWDEMNILATYHPPGKDYGHMKVDEPKTPFVFETDDATGYGASFSAEELAARLNAAKDATDDQGRPRATQDVDIVDPVEVEHARQFREKRKLHYNEFVTARLAKERLNADSDASEEDEELKRAQAEAARNARLNARAAAGASGNTDITERRSRSRSPVQKQNGSRNSPQSS